MELTSPAWGELSRTGGRAGVVARIGPPLPAPAYGPEQEPRAGAKQREVAEHLDDQQYPRGLGSGRDVPEPTVEKTVVVKYKASVRVSGSVKLAADARSITK